MCSFFMLRWSWILLLLLIYAVRWECYWGFESCRLKTVKETRSDFSSTSYIWYNLLIYSNEECRYHALVVAIFLRDTLDIRPYTNLYAHVYAYYYFLLCFSAGYQCTLRAFIHMGIMSHFFLACCMTGWKHG